ncbi:TonB-dependent receptor, partial [candidate division KSB1 bacterium]|nr:TonB-dependent receptor [candidate division KSB1 bacterium]
PPGTYDLSVTMMGYEKHLIPDVRVSVDQTTKINIKLKQTVLDLGESIVVVTDREAIQKDVAFSQTVMAASTLEMMPTDQRLESALENLAGVTTNTQGLVIRGSDEREISFFVDGLSMKDERTRRPYTLVNKSSIAEVQVLTGGFSAEYGDARSAVVNVITKEGASGYNFALDAQYLPSMRKHFGPNIWSPDNYWEVGKYLISDPEFDEQDNPLPVYDRDLNGEADWIGWNALVEKNWGGFFKTWRNPFTGTNHNMSPDQNGAAKAFAIWTWQHRSPYLLEWLREQPAENLPGGVKPHWVENYKSEEFDGVYKNWNRYAYKPDYQVDASFSGPLIPGGKNIPILGKTNFLISHNRLYQTYVGFAPQDYQVQNTQLKLTTRFDPSKKLTASAIYGEELGVDQMYSIEWRTGDPRFGIWDTPLGATQAQEANTQEEYMRRLDIHRLYNRDSELLINNRYRFMYGLKWTHQLNPRTFYEVGFAGSAIRYRTRPNSRVQQRDVLYPVYADEADTIKIMDYAGWWPVSNERDMMLGRNVLHHLGANYDFSETYSYRLKADLTSQINDKHEIKIGMDNSFLDLHIENGIKNIHGLFPGHEDDPEYIPESGFWEDNTYRYSYHGLYFIDKLEVKGMILQFGLRGDIINRYGSFYDTSDPFNEAFDRNLTNPDSALESIWDTDPGIPLQFAMSPRFSVSHPIGERSKLYFNYGHFYSIPDVHQSYAVEIATGGYVRRLGNPRLDMPKTIQYETGYEADLGNSLRLNIAAFYKSTTGIITTVSFSQSSPDIDYYGYQNGLARDVKGLEIQLRKTYGDYLAGWLTYDILAQRASDYSKSTDRNQEQNPQSRDTYRVFQDPFGSFTQPTKHTLKASISLKTPQETGPRVLGIHPLGGWFLDVYYNWQLGDQYLINTTHNISLYRQYTDRMKDYQMTDCRLSKVFQIKGANVVAYVQVKNLFNNKNMNVRINGYGEIATSAKFYNSSIWRTLDEDSRLSEDKAIEAYYEEIKRQGKRFGDDIGAPWMPKRSYLTYLHKRQIWFGLKLEL